MCLIHLPSPGCSVSQVHYRSLEGFPGLRQETLGSLDLCRGPQGASHDGSEKPGKLEVGGASRDSTGLGALEEGLISS